MTAVEPAAPRPAHRPASLRAVLAALLDDVPAILLDPRGRANLLAAGDTLPHVLSRRSLGLELRLQGPPCGDLFVGAVPTALDGPILHRWLRDGSLSDRSSLGRLTGALSLWQRREGWLARNCTFLLLEVDAGRRRADATPVPSVYLAPRGADDNNTAGDHHRNAFHCDPPGLIAALADLTGGSPDPCATAELERMLELLPAHAEIFAAGAMLSRPNAAAPRIAVRRLRAVELADVLHGLGRNAAAAALTPLATTLEPYLTNLCLALDLGPHAADAVGVELYTGAYWSQGDPAGWPALLQALVNLGLANPAVAEAVMGLPRVAAVDAPAVGLSHVKLTAVGDALAPSKYYVGYEGAHKLSTGSGEPV